MLKQNETIANDRVIKKGDAFNVGSTVLKTGVYICVPCGYSCHFNKGATFPLCFGCLEGKKYNGDIYIKGLGLWELL